MHEQIILDFSTLVFAIIDYAWFKIQAQFLTDENQQLKQVVKLLVFQDVDDQRSYLSFVKDHDFVLWVTSDIGAVLAVLDF